MDAFKRDFPIHTPITVAWGEMDALQHVNNVVYFRYFETARIDFFNQIGLMEALQATGIGPILAQTQCRFKRPVLFPDTLQVGTLIKDLQDDRFTMEYHIFSEAQQCVTTIGSAEVVVFDFNNQRKATLPAAIRARLENYSTS
ncbi:acyl-CoA thioester hydrolase [Ferrimonas sediminum]|uniref:Acyl-CoA thioester hydrolase n=1 Tax=Ferrimonas sediminum TaxID=718193 RepID=A0A1G8QA69_9GAMM|nr:thioesterase family protein [Ferrimonas sediminum]SDJ01375.1 acyl-CoA thioester hydrolase [Ferrimonas sediminum]